MNMQDGMSDESLAQPVEEAPAIVEKPPKPRKVRMVTVRGITRTAASALVEWAEGGDLRRAYVPREAVQDGKVSEEDLELGAQVGVPWEDFFNRSPTPLELARALRLRGIFTLDDMRRGLPQARTVFAEMQGTQVIDLLKAAEEVEK